MPSYDVNGDAVAHARKLIDDGRVDDATDWSDAAPSTEQADEVLGKRGWAEFARWHLAVDPEANEETKRRYAFPYGDFSTVNRAALIHAKQRASQHDHAAVEEAADALLSRLEEKRG